MVAQQEGQWTSDHLELICLQFPAILTTHNLSRLSYQLHNKTQLLPRHKHRLATVQCRKAKEYKIRARTIHKKPDQTNFMWLGLTDSVRGPVGGGNPIPQ